MSAHIVDVWMQHPTRRFLEQPFLESLRRWGRQDSIPDIPLSATIGAMDEAGYMEWSPEAGAQQRGAYDD